MRNASTWYLSVVTFTQDHTRLDDTRSGSVMIGNRIAPTEVGAAPTPSESRRRRVSRPCGRGLVGWWATRVDTA
jgi:hypothetical protein